MLCFRKFPVAKKFTDKRGGGGESRFSVEIFLSHSAEKTSPGNHSVFREISGRKKKLWIREVGAVSRFSIEKFLSRCTEIFHWTTLWCFRKFLSSKIFMHRRGTSRFCRNFLSHRTDTKNFVKEPFCFLDNFWYRTKIGDKRGHITIFSRSFYVSQCRKIS